MPAREGRRFVCRVADARGVAVTSRGLSRWLERVAPARAKGDVTVALVPDAVARALNKRYRRQDYATDVLSFPADRARVGAIPARPDARRPFLGDIVIATGVARRQARRADHGEAVELRILALHGLLHLLGYDHHRDGGKMARMERRLRRKGGLHEGLIERAGR